MSGISPLMMVQLLVHYHNYNEESRTFRFTKNDRMRVHKETEAETRKRKSLVNDEIRKVSEIEIRRLLETKLRGRIWGKIWIDPAAKKIAVPLHADTGSLGMDVLPTGSRIPIPEGKKIRAFTYWEKVNDIDLSCFGITDDGQQEEYSWRSMWSKQSDEICFSGDEVAGYHGGSEYFDIRLDLFRKTHPRTKYIVFCNNVFSNSSFKNCLCKAGFMMRDETDSGEIFEPKTVKTSFRMSADSRFGYLFAIDLDRREMIWLNLGMSSNTAVAGTKSMEWLKGYFNMTDIFNLHDLFAICAGSNLVGDINDPEITTVVTTDDGYSGKNGQNVVHSWDVEKMLPLLQ